MVPLPAGASDRSTRPAAAGGRDNEGVVAGALRSRALIAALIQLPGAPDRPRLRVEAVPHRSRSCGEVH